MHCGSDWQDPKPASKISALILIIMNKMRKLWPHYVHGKRDSLVNNVLIKKETIWWT